MTILSSCSLSACRTILRPMGFAATLTLLAATSSVQASSYWNNYGYAAASTAGSWGNAYAATYANPYAAYSNPYAAYVNPYAAYVNPYAGYTTASANSSWTASTASNGLYDYYVSMVDAFTWDYDDLYDAFDDYGYDDYSYDYGTYDTYDYYDYSYNDYMYDNYYYEPTSYGW